MVIGARFVWGHLPKTGGDATLALFRCFPHLILHADDRMTNDKHTRFRDRENEITGKLLVLNIRRLPSWILSVAQHLARWGVSPDRKRLPMPSADQMAESTQADNALKSFTDNGRLHIGRWLRMEHLYGDFEEFISDFDEVSEEKRTQIRAIATINGMTYDHAIDHWFTEPQLQRMYQANPLWASIEERVYPAPKVVQFKPR
jgi:hypothetical protein